MRHMTMAALSGTLLFSTMQCSDNESLNVFNGKMETAVAPLNPNGYSFLPNYYRMRSRMRPDSLKDSIRWIYDYPSQGASSVSIVISGQIETDSIAGPDDTTDIGIGANHIELGVETHAGGAPATVQISFDSAGGFIDTILIASAPQSGFLLYQNSRLFVKAGEFIYDTIQLINPHSQEGVR